MIEFVYCFLFVDDIYVYVSFVYFRLVMGVFY